MRHFVTPLSLTVLFVAVYVYLSLVSYSVTLFLEFCASFSDCYVFEMLQIYGKLVSSYILFYLLCQDALIKLASIFVIVFQFEPAHGIRHTVFGTRYPAYDLLQFVSQYQPTIVVFLSTAIKRLHQGLTLNNGFRKPAITG